MITPKWQEVLQVALDYFEEHLGPNRYYGAGSLFRGQWFGKGALKLGLDGTIDRDSFHRLCHNQNPGTGHQLTARQRSDRRIFCDFVISPPKSFSILALLGGDARLIALHREAALCVGRTLEQFAMCRVGNSDRETSNVIGAQFTDPTSRNQDPHLHDHLPLLNAVFDAVTGTWKALQNHEMLKAQKYVESVYYHLLAQGLIRFGYQIHTISSRSDFEIVGIDQSLIDRFSKRHFQIQESATRLVKAKGGNVKSHAEMLAHHEREPKQKGITHELLQARWAQEMTAREKSQLESLITHAKFAPSTLLAKFSPSAAISWALSHVLERRAVVRDHEVLRHALDRCRGSDVSLDQLWVAFAERRDVLRAGKSITTIEALNTDIALLQMAQEGKDKYSSIDRNWQDDSDLGPETTAVLRETLNQPNEHVILRGPAGNGYAILLRELCRAVVSVGIPIIVLVPEVSQVPSPVAGELSSPHTLESALGLGTLPEKSLIICEKADQVSSASLLRLFRLCRQFCCRIVLSEETRQHGPAQRGDALRSLEKYVDVKTFSLEQSRPQNLSKVRMPADAWPVDGIHEVTGDKTNVLTEEYVAYVKRGESALVVSLDRHEVSRLNEAIRQALQREAQIGSDQWEVTALISRDFTEVEKRDPRSYAEHSRLVLLSNLLNWKAGKVLDVLHTTDSGVVIDTRAKEKLLPWADSAKWQVCQPQSLTLAEGERLQLNRSQRAVRGKVTLTSGEIVEVAHCLRDGTIRIADGRSLSPEYRTFQLGYATTSYGSHGKTVDNVLVSDLGVMPATDARQWYANLSRGSKSTKIFTNDKAALMHRIGQHGQSRIHSMTVQPLAARPHRAGLRTRTVLRELAAQWVDRSRQNIRRCCLHMQVLRTINLAKEKRLAIRAASAAKATRR